MNIKDKGKFPSYLLSPVQMRKDQSTVPWIFHCFHFYSLFSFISNYILNCVHSITEIQLVEVYPVGLYHLSNFFLERFFNACNNCCSYTSLSLTQDNARLSLWNLSTSLTQVQWYANSQERKMHCLHSDNTQCSFCYLLIAFYLNAVKTVLNRTRCLQKFSDCFPSETVFSFTRLPLSLNNAPKWKYRVCDDCQN